jgi:AcrR family transcriptional regulator
MGTFSDVPSENVDTSNRAAVGGPADRRTRKREARRDHLLDLAADLVERDGIEGLTMAALAEAADYATASLYTYFPSRSALLAALQQRALHTLGRVAEEHLAAWDDALARTPEPVADEIAALARLWAFSDLFLSAPDRYPHEFRLQQRLLVTPNSEDTDDAASVVPAAMGVLDVPRRLLAAAVAVGALADHAEVLDPLGQPLDGAFVRTLAWVVALNGALLTDGLTTGLPATGAAIGRELTVSLLAGWGADPTDLTTARDLALGWAG